MGSGCSSPLRRLGGKRGKPSRRESSPYDGTSDEQADKQDEGNRETCQRKQSGPRHDHENEITIQSELNEDHPSSASYYTDIKNQNEETKISEHSGVLETKLASAPLVGKNSFTGGKNGVVARMIGLNGTYVPHDRHLLVSPALSPAPSTCYSPSPASSTPAGFGPSIDLNDLNDAFKILTFGDYTGHTNNNKRIKITERQQITDLNNQYTHQLVQSQNDLVSSISVIFITTDFPQLIATTDQPITTQPRTNLESLANHIESNLKSFCDEHLFNLEFLNLSHTHLTEYLHISNLQDVAMNILEQIYCKNSQSTVLVILSNSNNTNSVEINSSSDKGTKSSTQPLDKRQVPTKIEAQVMNMLQNTIQDGNAKELIKKWYNQVGDIFYLNPIYLVYPKILNESNEEREHAWQSWLNDSMLIISYIETACEADPEILTSLKLKSIFSSCIDFILNEPALQKRTLLIRNLSQPANSGTLSNQSQQQQSSKCSNLNELARLLADPNKMVLKRPMNQDEFTKTVTDWISENFSKFVESIQENLVTNGKHVPPFVERKLFTELTSQRHYLEHYLDNSTESYTTKCSNFYRSQIIPILDGFISGTISSQDSVPTDELQMSTNHLVFIVGPKGCGKSTLFSQLIRFTAQDLFNKAQIIYRFCGVSLDSLSPNRLLRSICEQFCQTQGENITAASYIYSARKEIMNALNKIINEQSSIIFLDGLDKFQQSDEELDLDWLFEIRANPRLKMFIILETDSKLYKRFLGSFTDATYISLDNPSLSEWAQMLTSTARTRRFNSFGNLYDEIKKQGESEPKDTSFTYTKVSDLLHMCRIRKLNNESLFPELTIKVIQNNLLQNSKTLHEVALSHLHYLLTPYQLCAFIIALNSSRNGLSEVDILSIMTLISQSTTSNPDYRFSAVLLNYLKTQLQPWLLIILCDKTVKISIQKGFAVKAIEYYVSNFYPNILNDIRGILLSFFTLQIRSKSSKGNINKGIDNCTVELKDHVNWHEGLCLGTKASETINLLILTNPSKAREHILNKNQFFLQFLYGSMPEEFVEDAERMKDSSKKSEKLEEIQILVNYIKQSIYPLRYDGSQIYSQIYCRSYETAKAGKLSKTKKLNEIMTMASCPPTRNLYPISETSINSFIKTRIGQIHQPNTQTSTSSLTTPAPNSQKTVKGSSCSNSQPFNQMQPKQRIYPIKDNHRHVIAIYPDKGIISVWDLYEEKAVRTINNLDQPKDLRMIDQKRAVVLCNRELRVYDLDSGVMITKLKGIMNQKMPFFEVFGDNYVVALARNRMYVNMLNLSTGELETTFKVGEDRFLNSLLVSADGGICVCGDETQKPFPLLVWNLNERRLMYDLRLERHEFITRMSAISDDGHFVVSVCMQISESETQASSSNSNNSSSSGTQKTAPNFIVIYDLSSGTMFKKWKPGLDTCSVAISLSANKLGKVINTIVDSSILVWDLATGSKRHTLTGHSAPADVLTVQNNRLFSMDSTSKDQSLRIWDIDEGYCLAVFSPDAPVNCCQISTRGDALICGFAAETRLSTLVMCKNETISDVVKRNKRRKSSKSVYIFDEPPSRKSSS